MDISNKQNIHGENMYKNNSYQFLHLETFALKPRKNTKRPSAEAVARECQRVDQSYPYITPDQSVFNFSGLNCLFK